MTPPAFLDKLCLRRDLPARLAALPRPMVFTNGVFDILHRGHATYLAQARAMGASLVLGLNSDASARKLGKGGARNDAGSGRNGAKGSGRSHGGRKTRSR